MDFTAILLQCALPGKALHHEVADSSVLICTGEADDKDVSADGPQRRSSLGHCPASGDKQDCELPAD